MTTPFVQPSLNRRNRGNQNQPSTEMFWINPFNAPILSCMRDADSGPISIQVSLAGAVAVASKRGSVLSQLLPFKRPLIRRRRKKSVNSSEHVPEAHPHHTSSPNFTQYQQHQHISLPSLKDTAGNKAILTLSYMEYEGFLIRVGKSYRAKIARFHMYPSAVDPCADLDRTILASCTRQ